MKNQSSYIDNLSSGHESKTVKEYDPKTQEGQLGKEHEEEVAKSNNWENDKRDAIGRAAKRKKLAKKLYRIAREIEAMDLDEDYGDEIEEIQDMVKDEIKEEKCDKKGSDEHLIIEATHPIEHDPLMDNPEANMSSQTGDDEWIDIGPGTFDDQRDEVGKAS